MFKQSNRVLIYESNDNKIMITIKHFSVDLALKFYATVTNLHIVVADNTAKLLD